MTDAGYIKFVTELVLAMAAFYSITLGGAGIISACIGLFVYLVVLFFMVDTKSLFKEEE